MNRIRRHMSATLSDACDGAALVTAIFVVTILFAIVITATIMSRQEGRIASNVADTVRAGLLAEGGANIAIAALNADLSTNRAITSIATIMRTYYGDQWKSQVYDRILDGRERDIRDEFWLPAYSWEDRNGNGLYDWSDRNGNGARDPGEPELDVFVGRYVFAIVDESSKININVAGNPRLDPLSETPRFAHLSNEGVSPAEIDIGAPWPPWEEVSMRSDSDGRANTFVFFRHGAPGGEPVLGISSETGPDPVDDSAFPGKATLNQDDDDDFDNLWVSSDGIDNDGDGLIDELNEGWDEPDEFRLFQPVEGDRAFKTIEQLILISGVGEAMFELARDLITVDSADREVIYNPQAGDTRKQDLRINLNLDDARTIAKTMIEKRPGYFGPGPANITFANRARAFQIAANIADFRDKDFARTEIVDDRRVDNDGDGRLDEDWIDGTNNDGDLLGFDGRDNDGDGLIDEEGEGIDEDPFEPGVDADGDNETLSNDGVDNDGDGYVDEGDEGIDEDWVDPPEVIGNDRDNDGDGLIDEDPPQVDVYAGIEDIRINEIMVRPTRRVEAEGGPGFSVDQAGVPPEWQLDYFDDGVVTRGSFITSAWVDNLPPGGDDVNDIVATWRIDAVDVDPIVGGPGLLPTGLYYLILDFSSANGEPTTTAVDYRVIAGTQDTGWESASPWAGELINADLEPVPFLVDMDPITDRIDPVYISSSPPPTPVFIQLRKRNDDDGLLLPVHFNGAIFSQEPDMEWVELVNIGTRPVRLDGWELEIAGGPIGTIPPGTGIDPGDLVLLAVDKDDFVDFPLGANPDISVFWNWMSMQNLAQPGPFATFPIFPRLQGNWNNVVQLVFRNNAVEATEEIILGGGMFPNNPRYDGIDNDGDRAIDESYLETVSRAEGIALPVIGEMQVVTLYEGPAQWGRVVDRVTYSSADVANAWRTFVLRDQPELDFYRSLERTNPYYVGDRPRDGTTNELRGYIAGGYLDGSYDDWARNDGVGLSGLPSSRFATPLLPNVTAVSDSDTRGDFELALPRVKNASFSTVGELVDVPFYDSSWPPERFRDPAELRPTTLSIWDAAAIIELATTSRMDLTVGQSELVGGGTGWRGVDAARYLAVATGEELLEESTPIEPPDAVAYYARDPAEAVWQWDIDDGLEDGVYNLYVFVGEGLWGHPGTRPVAIEVFSDINNDNYLDPALGSVDSFGVLDGATARPDSVVSYGTVQVRGNMLAVKVVNLAETNILNTFTRIALSPRRRDYGKININTVWPRTVTRKDDAGNVIDTATIDPLCALPGLLQVWDGNRLIPSPDSSVEEIRNRARDRANAILWIRADIGGGYRSVGGLLQELAAPPPTLWSNQLDTTRVIDTESWPVHTRDLVLMKETLERFKHISNLITERSDVFEIICVAQAGQYLGGEFVPAAEKKIRVIYER